MAPVTYSWKAQVLPDAVYLHTHTHVFCKTLPGMISDSHRKRSSLTGIHTSVVELHSLSARMFEMCR